MKKISLIIGVYNEEENINELYRQLKEQLDKYDGKYEYEIIFIDNASTDSTVEKVKELIQKDSFVRLIINMRNFGQVRSHYHGVLQTNGDAIITMASDLQDPPYLISEFISYWEAGYKNVIGVKNKTNENKLMSFIRKAFYNIIARISETEQIKNFTGFGLYDREFIDALKTLDDPYPYFRGLITEIGMERKEIPYTQPLRKKGKTKNNFFTLYDIAMLGFVNHSKLPLRLASFIGFIVGFLSIVIAFIYFVYKLLLWDTFQVGMAPVVIGIFFFSSVQLFFIGIIGEYIGSIYTQVKKRPLVYEKTRINFPTKN